MLNTGRNVNINGFGYTDGPDKIPAEVLQRGSMQILDCNSLNVSFLDLGVRGDQVCAHSAGVDSCQGDSGGGLTTVVNVGREKSPIPVLVGLTSYGDSCSGNQPGVYTNVKTHMQWIIQKIFGKHGKFANSLGILQNI